MGMRIIAGEFKGRKLLSPEGDQTRPVTDRVKQSIFDILAPVIEGAQVFDCFAGTGSFGLESLSRGAAHSTFFEAHRPTAVRLKKNLQLTKVEERSTVITADIFEAIAAWTKANIDIVFLDPPYRYLRERPEQLQKLFASLNKLLAPGGIVVFRHDLADTLELSAFTSADQRTYGQMSVEFLGRTN